MNRSHRPYRLLAAMLLVALPACSITWRQRPIEPLDTDRTYAAGFEDAWAAIERTVTGIELEVRDRQQEDGVGLLETGYSVLSDTGDDINRLDKIAYAGPGGFIGGRYTLTVTVRSLRSGDTRVKVNTRIEGYVNEEFGYQVLRSRGLIEDRIFTRIGTALGTEPVE